MNEPYRVFDSGGYSVVGWGDYYEEFKTMYV